MSRRMREYGYDAAFLRQIAPPTLCLWGEADPFGGVAIGMRCAATRRNAALRRLTGVACRGLRIGIVARQPGGGVVGSRSSSPRYALRIRKR